MDAPHVLEKTFNIPTQDATPRIAWKEIAGRIYHAVSIVLLAATVGLCAAQLCMPPGVLLVPIATVFVLPAIAIAAFCIGDRLRFQAYSE